MEGFVDEAKACIGAQKLLQAGANLFIIGRSKGLHHDAHGPDGLFADVRAADALPCRAAPEVGVVGAPHKTAGVLVYWIRCHGRFKVGQGQQAGHIGIVHQVLVAEAIHLKGINGPVNGMLVHCVFLKRRCHLVGQDGAAVGQIRPVVDGGEYLSRLSQNAHGEEVGGHKELELRSVVRGTEGRSYEADGLDWVAKTHAVLGVQLAVCLAEEVVGAVAVFALLNNEGVEYGLYGFYPLGTEYRCIAGYLPVLVCQTYRVAVGIHLPFALEDVGVVRSSGFIGSALACRAVIEGIGVGVYANEAELGIDYAGYHLAKMLVFVGISNVGPDLGAGITEPHCVDVTGIHEGYWRTVLFFTVMYGCVQGVGETVNEHPAELRVLNLSRNPVYLPLYGFAYKKPVLRRRTP